MNPAPSSAANIRMHKIIALVEHGLALFAGQGVAEAVSEVEVGGMAAALAVVTVGLAGDFGLLVRDGLDDDL